MFSHEKLNVYQEALRFVADAEAMAEQWEKRHAIADHLPRAAESIVLNLAEASRESELKPRQLSADYSLGSVFECAGCLDMAEVKALATADAVLASKQQLRGICGKLIGLRKSWEELRVCEDGAEYEVRARGRGATFHHERLDVYQAAIQLVRGLHSGGLLDRLSAKKFREMDKALTGIVLNIAEGNGRYAELDQQRFVKAANRSAIRLAALLDVCAAKGLWKENETAGAKRLLVRIADMTAGLAGMKG